MPHEPDPLTQVYCALWSLLDDRPVLRKLVRPRNWIQLAGVDAASPTQKEQTSTKDLPELRLIPTVTAPHVQSTSNSSFLTKTFEIQVATGEKRVDEIFFPIEWEIFQAFANWAAVLRILKWKGKKFVVSTRPVSAQSGVELENRKRNIVGWASIWSCEVFMSFQTTSLGV